MPVKSSALLFVTLVALLVPVGTAFAGGAKGNYTETLLSNERDTSRWAFVSAGSVSAWSRPGNAGRKLLTLTRRTPDGTSELVLTLRERVYSNGSVWTEVRLPMRGADVRGWVSRSKLDKYRVIHTRIEIDRAALTAKLFKNEQLIWQAPIAVGKSARPTPSGSFYVRNRLETTDAKGRFGPFALGLSTSASRRTDWPGGRTVGIHGTDRPKDIPGHTGDPCVRIKNDKLRGLFKLTPPGTPVKIN